MDEMEMGTERKESGGEAVGANESWDDDERARDRQGTGAKGHVTSTTVSAPASPPRMCMHISMNRTDTDVEFKVMGLGFYHRGGETRLPLFFGTSLRSARLLCTFKGAVIIDD